MMKIHALNYRILRNEEFLGLHRNFVELAANISDEGIRPSIEAYRKSVADYANLIEVVVDDSAASVASRLDTERNAAYTSCKNFAKSLKSLSNSDVVATGERLRRIFSENADPTRLNQDQATGTFTNLINSLKAIGEDKLVACGFTPWLENLERKHNEYLAAAQKRDNALATKVRDANRTSRERCLEDFRLVTTLAIGKATLDNDEGCEQFVKAVNVHIDQKKVQLKLRKAKGKNATGSPESAMAVLPAETKVEENAA